MNDVELVANVLVGSLVAVYGFLHWVAARSEPSNQLIGGWISTAAVGAVLWYAAYELLRLSL